MSTSAMSTSAMSTSAMSTSATSMPGGYGDDGEGVKVRECELRSAPTTTARPATTTSNYGSGDSDDNGYEDGEVELRDEGGEEEGNEIEIDNDHDIHRYHGHDHSHDHSHDHPHSHDDHENHSISDPLSDPEELKALTSTLSSYFLYRRTAHLNLTHHRRRGYWGLPRRHREILERAMGGEKGGGYLGMLAGVDEAIADNAEVAEGIFASGVGAFGIPADVGGGGDDDGPTSPTRAAERIGEGGDGKDGKSKRKPWWERDASSEDMDKVKSTLKQLYRDWAKEGEEERNRCYKPVLDELCERFPLNLDVDVGENEEEEEESGREVVESNEDENGEKRNENGGGIKRRRRDEIKVLLPGAGLGRLAFDVVCAGFESQGNEFSYHQLVASNFMLNCTTKANEFTLHPFIHTFSHHLTRENHLRAVKIPDVHPGDLLTNPTGVLPYNPYSPPSSPSVTTNTTTLEYSLPATRFSMIAGDFLQCYSAPTSPSSFDAVATVFFIDTAPNVLAYIETIYKVLKVGGVWINLGPLLWHWEGRDPPKRGAGGRGGQQEDAEGVGIEGMGAVELTLEEVLRVVEGMGFRIEKRGVDGGEGEVLGEVRTGYIQDERSMLNYEYRAQFWVAIKV